MLRKFFEPAIAEPKAEPRIQIGESLSLEDVIGNRNNDLPEQKQEEKIEEKKEEKIEEKPIISEKKEEVKEVPASVTPDWKDFVKKPEHRKEVHSLLNIDEDALTLYKDLSQDEFIKKLVTYRKENGNVTPFIEAATKDYDKYSHFDLLRDDLKKQYPNLSKDKFDILAKNRIDKRFILGEDADPDEVQLAAIDLEVEGERIRQLRKDEQKTYLDSVKPVDRAALVQKEIKEKMDADLKENQEFVNNIETSPVTSRLFSEKKVVFGDKESPVNYTVDPVLIKEQTLDSNKFYGLFWEGEGDSSKFNQEKWSKVVAYANNMAAVEKLLIDQGRSSGTGKLVEELENSKEKTDQSPKVEKKSLAKAFKEEGQAITLQEMYG